MACADSRSSNQTSVSESVSEGFLTYSSDYIFWSFGIDEFIETDFKPSLQLVMVSKINCILYLIKMQIKLKPHTFYFI